MLDAELCAHSHRGHQRSRERIGARYTGGTTVPYEHLDSHEHVDVLIVGAGLSGIGAGVPPADRVPGQDVRDPRGARARSAAPGTCSAIRASARTRTCTRWATRSGRGRSAKAIADGPSILSYVRETAREHGMDEQIRFGHRVVRAEWSSADARWTVEVEPRRHGRDRAH